MLLYLTVCRRMQFCSPHIRTTWEGSSSAALYFDARCKCSWVHCIPAVTANAQPADFGDNEGSYRDRLKCMQIMLSRHEEGLGKVVKSKSRNIFQFTQPCTFLRPSCPTFLSMQDPRTRIPPVLSAHLHLASMERDRHIHFCAPSIGNPVLLIVSTLGLRERKSR